MSDSETHEKLTVSSDGVRVEKRYEPDEFPVPAIAFDVSSNRNEPVTVTLVDEVPDDVAVDDLGFHPEYGSDLWEIEADEITFRRELQAGESYTTVYGIRATGVDDVEQFLTEPEIASVETVDGSSGGPVVDESGSNVVRDVISGDSDSVPGLDDSDDEIETLDLKDPNEDDSDDPFDDGSDSSDTDQDAQADSEEDAEEGETDAESDDVVETTDDESVASETLTRQLADEIRNGNVSGDDIKLLRRALELAGKEGGSVDARLQQLQTDVSDLRAYTNALEEFLDENGTAQELLEEMQTDLEAMESDIDDLESTTETNSSAIDDLETSVDEVADVQQTVDDLQSDVQRLLSNVKSVENDVEDIDARVGDIDSDVESRIEELQEDIEELQEWREQLSSVIG